MQVTLKHMFLYREYFTKSDYIPSENNIVTRLKSYLHLTIIITNNTSKTIGFPSKKKKKKKTLEYKFISFQ